MPALGIVALFELFLCNAMEQKSECGKPDPEVKNKVRHDQDFLLQGNAKILIKFPLGSL
jgi:hypothetical protein